MKKTIGFLRLMRPANIITAIADVLAGIVVSCYLFGVIPAQLHVFAILLLCISTAALYGGGVVFNDVFDYDLDKIERPERAIPSGLITITEASVLGIILFLLGISAAFVINMYSGIMAFTIAIVALLYDKWGKHHFLLGPVNMGVCRGLNLLLGFSFFPYTVPSLWYIAIVPVIYIAAITMISRGEVHGSNRNPLYGAAFLYLFVIVLIFCLAFYAHTLLYTLPFLLLFVFMIFKPLLIAIREPSGSNIGKSVKAGVIALILMDASWAASFGSLAMALIIILLLPISMGLARLFAVT